MKASPGRGICTGLLLVLVAGMPALGAEETPESSLRAAELAFAASVAAKDLEAFERALEDDAIFAAGAVLQGKQAILAGWAGFFTAEAPRLEWHPETVVVRPDGLLGISQGPYTLTMAGPDGKEIVQQGRFISVWQRQDDGDWKILFDSGCPPCPGCGDP